MVTHSVINRYPIRRNAVFKIFFTLLTLILLAGCGEENTPTNSTPTEPTAPTVDNSPPVISFANPKDGDTMRDRRPQIELNYSDNIEIDQSSIVINIVNEAITFSCSITPTKAECTPDFDFPIGTVNLSATVADRSRNTATASISVTIEEEPDTIAPEIIISSPMKDSRSTNRTPEILIGYSDNKAIQAGSLTVELNGKNIINNCTIGDTEAECKIDENLPFGVSTAIASVSDVAGNKSSDSVSFTVDPIPDTEAPLISIKSPANGSTHTSRKPLMEVKFTDNESLNLSSFSLTVNDTDLTQTCAVEDSLALCKPITNLPLGKVNIFTQISDSSGNIASATISIVILLPPDIIAPTIRISSPNDGVTLQNRRPTIGVLYDDDVKLDLPSFSTNVGGADITSTCTIESSGASCQPNADIPLGRVAITAEISDTSGNRASNTVNITVEDPPDLIAPTIRISSPNDGVTLQNRRPTIGVLYDDDVKLDLPSFSINVGGADITSTCTIESSGASCQPNADIPLGRVAITAEVSDTSDNRASNTINITVEDLPDNEKPIISITSALEITISDEQQSINVSYDDDRELNLGSLSLLLGPNDVSAGCTATESSASCLVGSDLLSPGTLSVHASISDKSGNVGVTQAVIKVNPYDSDTDTTLAGLDENQNGIRDDVEVFIEVEYSNEPHDLKAVAMEAAKNLQSAMMQNDDPEASEVNFLTLNKTIYCLSKINDQGYMSNFRKILYETINTELRAETYYEFSKSANGQIRSLPSDENLDTFCSNI